MVDQLTRQISELYLSGLSIKRVGGIVSLSHSHVRRRLVKKGTPRRSIGEANRKYSLNEDFFEIIDTEEKAYWLGFIAADGNINSNRRQVIFSLAIKDKKMVEKFKEALESTNPIHYYSRKINGRISEKARLIIRSKKLCNDLINKGVVPRKSLILKPPKNVPNHLVRHWVRGYFDGDGSVYFRKIKRNGSRRKRVSISGTEEVMRFIQKKLGLGHIHDSRPRAQVHSFRIGSQTDVEKFADYIYQDATVHLERKKLIFESSL